MTHKNTGSPIIHQYILTVQHLCVFLLQEKEKAQKQQTSASLILPMNYGVPFVNQLTLEISAPFSHI